MKYFDHTRVWLVLAVVSAVVTHHDAPAAPAASVGATVGPSAKAEPQKETYGDAIAPTRSAGAVACIERKEAELASRAAKELAGVANAELRRQMFAKIKAEVMNRESWKRECPTEAREIVQ